MIAILGSLSYEIEGIKKNIQGLSPKKLNHCAIFEKEGLLLVQTGMGRGGAVKALEIITDNYPLKLLISTGFASAVKEGIKPGDMVAYNALYCLDEDLILHPQERLFHLAVNSLIEAKLRFFIGGGLTVPRLICSSRIRQQIGEDPRITAIDMESYWLAQGCDRKGIPFLAIRAISDTLKDELPDLGAFLSPFGVWHKRRAMIYFCAHPLRTIKLFQLYLNSSRAQRNLTLWFNHFLKVYRD